MKKIFVFLFLAVLLAGCTQVQPVESNEPSLTPESSETPRQLVPTVTVLSTPTYYFPIDTPELFINPTPDADLADVQVRYVGNSGFLVTIGEYKVLIDGLFLGFNGACALPAVIYDVVANGEPPFDDIDLILATHNHSDHFDAAPVRLYMQEHPEVVLASTAQVTSQLSEFGGRVITLDAAEGQPAQADINGIHVVAFYLTHGTPPAGEAEIVNIGYVVTVNGISFFHTGDIDLNVLPATVFQGYGFPEMDLDLAFISHFYLESVAFQSLITDTISSRYIISSHHLCSTTDPDQSQIERYFPGTIFFTHELETWGSP